MNKNMYLIHKATGRIHAYFKQNAALMTPLEGQSPSFLSGSIYVKNPDWTVTLDRLKKMNHDGDFVDYDDNDDEATYLASISDPFRFLQTVHYASYKGYRIIHFAERIQIGADFSNNDLIEAQAFVALLFQRVVGDAEIEEFNEAPWDKYGLLARISEEFTIEGDDDELIYDSVTLTDRPQLESPFEERWADKRRTEREASS